MSLTAKKFVGGQKLSHDGGDYVPFDRELEDLPEALCWRQWMGRIEAVLFASSSPVSHEDFSKLFG